VIDLETVAEGVLLTVRAHAAGPVNAIRGIRQGALRVSVTQVAEKGKANRAIAEVLAKELDLRKADVELISGATAATKKFLLRNINEETLIAKLQKYASED